MAKNIKSTRGFTIIEVVLVLAIAGLIFLMVFVAYPALARNQRDTQRRNDYAMLSTAVTNFSVNSGGKLPIKATTNGKGACSDSFDKTKNIGDEGKDPNGLAYGLACYSYDEYSGLGDGSKILKAVPNTDTASTVYVISGANCGTDGLTPTKASSSRAFVIYGNLESGVYCSASD